MAKDQKLELPERFTSEISIPPCPTVLLAVIEEIRKPTLSFKKLSAMISQDPGLSGAMIGAANSSYFGLSSKVQTLQHAMAVLGLDVVRDIMMDLVLRNTFSQNDGISMGRFWERSNYFAKSCSGLAAKLTNLPREEAYSFGLFHDAGIPLMMKKFPGYKDTLKIANESADRPFLEIERERHGVTHAAIGHDLARNWALSDSVCEAILHHHDIALPGYIEGNNAPGSLNMVAVGVLAEHLTNTFLRRPIEAEWQQALPAALQHFELSAPQFEQLSASVCDDLCRQRNEEG